MSDSTLLSARGLSLRFGTVPALVAVDMDLWPGEILAIVGESGSGKTTLLNVLSGLARPDAGAVWYRDPSGLLHDVHGMAAPALRTLHRSDWGFVHQDPRRNLRMGVSAGGNIGERLMAAGARQYGEIRAQALHWLAEVEIDADRLDDLPRVFSGGMLQRLQIARTLVTHPRLVFMDEPTGGLDVSVQARLLDLIRGLVAFGWLRTYDEVITARPFSYSSRGYRLMSSTIMMTCGSHLRGSRPSVPAPRVTTRRI